MVFSYPVWYIALCAALGLLLSGLLYFRDRTFSEAGVRNLLPVFALLRFLSITAIAILLLSPVLRYRQTEREKPIVVVAVDNSSSLANTTDSASLAAIASALEENRKELGSDFEVRTFQFGESLQESDLDELDFKAPATDLSNALESLYDRFSGRNVGAVVLASDGIYNSGSNPAFGGRRLPAPIFSIALGDTAVRRDLAVTRTYANRLVYLGDRFTLRADWRAVQAGGSATSIRVEQISGGRAELIEQRPVRINGELFDGAEEFILEATETGVIHFRVTVLRIEDEITAANNYRDVFVDVLDARQKILLLAHSPHPDLAAFRAALESNRNYEVETALAGDLVGNPLNPEDYDLVILHQLPTLMFPVSSILDGVANDQVPALFVLGSMTDLNVLPQAQDLVRIRPGRGATTNDVQATIRADFPLFQLDDDVRTALRAFPPLHAPFGDYRTGAEGAVLMTQRIGTVDTQYPLLVFGSGSRARTGVLTGEGIWRWRLFDYLENGNHDQIDQLIVKSVQYLSVKGDRRQFRVTLDKRVYGENERISFGAQLYNDSYEPVNDPDVDMTITEVSTGQDGREYEFRFDRRTDAYQLDAGSLPPGEYAYRANTSLGGKSHTAEGIFSVTPMQLEAVRLQADHGLLAELAVASKGEVLMPDQLSGLSELLRSRNEIRPVLHESVRTRDVIHLKAIFFGLLLLLGLEWFLRKLSGGY